MHNTFKTCVRGQLGSSPHNRCAIVCLGNALQHATGCHFLVGTKGFQKFFLVQPSAKVVLVLGIQKLFGDTKNFFGNTFFWEGHKVFFWYTKNIGGYRSFLGDTTRKC